MSGLEPGATGAGESRTAGRRGAAEVGLRASNVKMRRYDVTLRRKCINAIELATIEEESRCDNYDVRHDAG